MPHAEIETLKYLQALKQLQRREDDDIIIQGSQNSYSKISNLEVYKQSNHEKWIKKGESKNIY